MRINRLNLHYYLHLFTKKTKNNAEWDDMKLSNNTAPNTKKQSKRVGRVTETEFLEQFRHAQQSGPISLGGFPAPQSIAGTGRTGKSNWKNKRGKQLYR